MPIKCGNGFVVEIVSGSVAPNDTDLLETVWDGNPETIDPVPLEIRMLVENQAKVIAVDGAGLITFDRPHGLAVSDPVFVWDMGGLYEVHGDRVVATVPSAKTLTLTLSTTYSQWTGGGLIRKVIYGPEDMLRIPDGRLYHIVPATVEFAPDQAYAVSLWQKLNNYDVTWYAEVPERAQQARLR